MAIDKTKSVFLEVLGKRIASLREKNGLNQTELAEECEKDRQSINRLEKGNINPSIFFLFQVSKALKISLSELLDLKDLK